ncbi:hypothetical protein FB451DRAFT_1565056 [Mycena latifolia]|nr:hypothetical protein FB451DRAFT_1565056 [Mycena latifolia]
MPTTSTSIESRPVPHLWPDCNAPLSFVEVAPASRRISARHRLHNVSEPQAAESPAPEPSVAEHPATPEEPAPPSEPEVAPAPESEDYVPPMVITDSSNPGAFTDEPVPAIAEEPKPAPDAPAPEDPQPQHAVDQPAQGAAPAVDEAAYLDLVPAAPLQHARGGIAQGRGRGGCSRRGALGGGVAIPVRPAAVQASQDASVEPVAEANVHRAEGAEVPQPRQWADESGWFLLLQPSHPPPEERGLPRSEDDSVYLLIAVVDHDREAEVERRDVDEGEGISSIRCLCAIYTGPPQLCMLLSCPALGACAGLSNLNPARGTSKYTIEIDGAALRAADAHGCSARSLDV